MKFSAIFTEKHLCWSLLLINIQSWRPATLLRRDSVKFAKFLRTPIFTEHTGGCFWKYLMNFLFIAFENNEWCYFVVLVGSPVFISFYCVCFASFYFFSFFWFFFVDPLLFSFEISLLSILKTKQWNCS